MNKKISLAMKVGIKQATYTSQIGIGGPFGACVVDSKTGEVLVVASNEVLENNDPTAHAEIQAIRKACHKLGKWDLSGYTLYATGYPCPMCMSAIIWANVDKLIYGANSNEAANIGFRDDFIYDFIRNDNCNNPQILPIEWEEVSQDEIIKMYNNYKQGGEMY